MRYDIRFIIKLGSKIDVDTSERYYLLNAAAAGGTFLGKPLVHPLL